MPFGFRCLPLGARRFAFSLNRLPFGSLAFARCPCRLTRRSLFMMIGFLNTMLF
ncbi:MAG: hypothetical protein JSR44_01545 [Spirochaetes bacterium]|nr:hypothetical protein [Spirochaetota bacterium]